MANISKISEGIEAMFGGASPARRERAPEDKPSAAQERRQRGGNLGHGGPSAIRNRYPTSLVVDREKYDKIRMIALANSLNINEVVDAALDMCIEAYERSHGSVTPRESRISAREIISPRKRDSRKQ